jgi:ADP-ribose pyrophosphatase
MAIVFSGRKFRVEVAKRRYPDGREHEVEVVRHPPVVVLIPIERDGRVVLIKQYRAAIERETWEVPAGGIEPGEDADAAARRECEEEIGRVPQHIERLGEWYSTPGFCDELMIFCRVSDLREPPADSPNRPDDDELIEPRVVTLDEARGMVRRGEIVDLKTAFALTLVQEQR